MNKFCSILLLWIITSPTIAQEGNIKIIEHKNKLLKVIEFEVKKNILYTNMDPEFTSTSLAVEIPENADISKSYVFLGPAEKFEIKHDEHNESGKSLSQLMISTIPFNYLSFFSGNYEGTIRFRLLYAKPLKNNASKAKKKNALACEKPESIDQSIWREGLPAPTVEPTVTTVKHIILHHSAGSNTNTDYINTVRNIYLDHTQNQGWDDIGYNYLVAPDGSIFDGRDGKTLGDDNVKGAHFCAKNSGTMGICLLGDYMTALPSDLAINSIEALIAWKLNKENLSPLDSFMHPAGTVDATMLGTISAHRDGCNTLCNGDNYYALKGAIKDSVWAMMKICAPATGIIESKEADFNIYPNPAYSEIQLNTTFKENCEVKIFNVQGIKVAELILPANENRINIAQLEQGYYLLRFYNTEKQFSKILIKQ